MKRVIKVLLLLILFVWIFIIGSIIEKTGCNILNYTNISLSNVLNVFWKMIILTLCFCSCFMFSFYLLKRNFDFNSLELNKQVLIRIILFVISIPFLLSSVISGILFIFFLLLNYDGYNFLEILLLFGGMTLFFFYSFNNILNASKSSEFKLFPFVFFLLLSCFGLVMTTIRLITVRSNVSYDNDLDVATSSYKLDLTSNVVFKTNTNYYYEVDDSIESGTAIIEAYYLGDYADIIYKQDASSYTVDIDSKNTYEVFLISLSDFYNNHNMTRDDYYIVIKINGLDVNKINVKRY